MTDDPDDHDKTSETSVDIDTSLVDDQPTLTVTGITLTGEALAAAASAGLLPADSEPSTIEPMVGVRALAGTRPIAEDEEERTTLNIESRLLGAFEEAREAPPVKQLPSTSTTPNRKVSKSPTMKGMGVPLPPTPRVERPQAPSEPTLDDERNDETIDRPPPSKAVKEPAKALTKKPDAAPAVEAETDDADTSIDASLLSGGLSLAAVADAASGFEGNDADDEVPTSIRREPAAQVTTLSSSDLVTDAGRPPNPSALAMALLPTAPAPFPISPHVQIDGAPPMPLGAAGTVRVVADGTGSTPVAHADLPARWPPVPSAADPAVVASRPRRRGRMVVLLAFLACVGAFVIVRRAPNKTTLVITVGSPAASAASSDSPPPPTSATAEPDEDLGPPTTIASATASATASASASATATSAPEPAKARVAPPHKPPQVWRPPARPALPPPTAAPKASAWMPLHI